MKTMALKIDGMHCDGCAGRVTTLLEKEPGVRDAKVSFATGTGRVTYNSYSIEEKRIIEVVQKAGFRAVST